MYPNRQEAEGWLPALTQKVKTSGESQLKTDKQAHKTTTKNKPSIYLALKTYKVYGQHIQCMQQNEDQEIKV